MLQGKPQIPAFNRLDLGTEQSKAITNNANALPAAEDLASKTNTFNIDQLQQMLRKVIPGYDTMVSGATKNITNMLAGELPSDVSSAIERSGAAKALSGGFSGTGMHGDLVARDLGLTSLDLTQKGLSTAQSWIQSMAQINSPNMFNVSSMFISPQQQFQADQSERDSQFQHDYVSNLNDWQHSFGYAAGKDLMNTGNFMLSMFGGMMGGGGGMGGMTGGSGGSGAPSSGSIINQDLHS